MAIDMDSFLDIELEENWPVLLFDFNTLIEEGVSAYRRDEIKEAVQRAGEVLHVRVIDARETFMNAYDSFFGRGSPGLTARHDVLESLMDNYELYLPEVSATDRKGFRTLYEFGWREDLSFDSHFAGALSIELFNHKQKAYMIFKARRFISTQPQDQVFTTLLKMSNVLRKSFKITLSDN